MSHLLLYDLFIYFIPLIQIFFLQCAVLLICNQRHHVVLFKRHYYKSHYYIIIITPTKIFPLQININKCDGNYGEEDTPHNLRSCLIHIIFGHILQYKQ